MVEHKGFISPKIAIETDASHTMTRLLEKFRRWSQLSKLFNLYTIDISLVSSNVFALILKSVINNEKKKVTRAKI